MPAAPPNEMMTSPPIARRLLMSLTYRFKLSGVSPFHVAVQLPLLMMNASVQNLCPVVLARSVTDVRFHDSTYGAANRAGKLSAPPPPPPPPVVIVNCSQVL